MLIVLCFSLIGGLFIIFSHAAVPAVSLEAESGAATSTAKTASSTSASNGKYIRFSTGTASRAYPLHTRINATTLWVGELFQDTPDGSQVCSAYNSNWIYSFFKLKKATNCKISTSGRDTGCDAVLKNEAGKCNDTNSIGSLRTPANGYFPAGLQPIYENPFYLDLPYDDYNPTDSTDITGWATRCADIPWANDPGYAGKCTNSNFSYMKNRWVKITANGKTCYGQNEDAGPADDGNGNPHYDDRVYVFGANDARPINKSYNSAGMDISPALNACLGGTFNEDLTISWQWVEAADVPVGPWTTIVTKTLPEGVTTNEAAYLSSITP